MFGKLSRRVYVPVYVLIPLLIMLFSGLVYAVARTELYYEHEVTVTSQAEIQMYVDEACSILVTNGTTIEWEDNPPGEYLRDYWIRNTGTCSVKLNLQVSDLPSDWTLTWNSENVLVDVGAKRKITFTLEIPVDTDEGIYVIKSWIKATEV